MKKIIFEIRKATEEETKNALKHRQGAKPFDYGIHIDYWLDGKTDLDPNGEFTCSRYYEIGNIIDHIKKKENMI